MNRRTWQKREQAAAADFGARRNVGSGSLGRDDRSRSDSTHDTLYIECKASARHAVVTLWDDTAKKAKKEKKTPVVVLSVKNRPGRWYLVKDSDLQTVAGCQTRVTVDDLSEIEETA